MRSRILLLAAALVVALAGTGVVFAYASSRANPAQAAEERATVLVAKALIPAGTSGQQAVEQQLVALSDVPVSLVPTGALADVVAIREQEAAVDVQQGEILLPGRFVSTAVAGSIEIPDDKVAVSIDVADSQRVAGFVRPGSEVAVFDTYAVEAVPVVPADDQPVPVVEEATRLLLPRATVIAVGPTALKTVGVDRRASAEGEQAEEATAGSGSELAALVTLAVPINEAQKVAHAAQTGKITLSLLNPDSRTDVSGPDDNRTLFD